MRGAARQEDDLRRSLPIGRVCRYCGGPLPDEQGAYCARTCQAQASRLPFREQRAKGAVRLTNCPRRHEQAYPNRGLAIAWSRRRGTSWEQCECHWYHLVPRNSGMNRETKEGRR